MAMVCKSTNYMGGVACLSKSGLPGTQLDLLYVPVLLRCGPTVTAYRCCCICASEAA